MAIRGADAGLERTLIGPGMGRLVARGLRWSMLGEWASYAVQVGTTMVLARVLTPGDFGVMAMALTLTVVVNQFRHLGLSHAVVQKQDLTWNQVNGLFWVNTAAGVFFGLVVAAGGLVLAAFYREPQLVAICAALGGGYLISGLAVQHSALLNRRMQFRTIAVRNTVAGMLASAAAVVAALAGMGVWALVVQNIAMLVFSSVVVWLAVRWRPSRPRGLRETWPLLKFGTDVTVANLFFTVSRQADNVLIGRFLDAGALGLYTRAYGLLTLPLRQLKNPVSAVMVPTLAALQDDRARFRATYRRAVSGLAHLGMPLVTMLAVAAYEVVDVLLGRQWTPAAHVFQLLAIASLLQLVSTTSGWLFVSCGRTRPYAIWSVLSAAVAVAAFAIGLRWGIGGVAASYAICQVVLLVPAFAMATRDTPVRLADPFAAMVRPLVVAAVVGACAFGAREAAAELGSLPKGLLTAMAGVAGWALVLGLWRSARAEVADLVGAVRGRRTVPTAGGGARDAQDAGSARSVVEP